MNNFVCILPVLLVSSTERSVVPTNVFDQV